MFIYEEEELELTVTVVYLSERLNVYCARNQKGHTIKLAQAICLRVHILGFLTLGSSSFDSNFSRTMLVCPV
jgi:hypothetical protein